MIEAQPPDDSTEPDPVEAELIAYLDGELEATDARRIEDQLDGDPKLRARAEGLKRSFDLLDFLPKPEPSSNFATRTMDKLPVSAKPAGIATTLAPRAIPSSMSSLALPGFAARRSAPSWVWAMGLSTKAIKSLLSRARSKLREALQGYIYMEGEPPPGDAEDES